MMEEEEKEVEKFVFSVGVHSEHFQERNVVTHSVLCVIAVGWVFILKMVYVMEIDVFRISLINRPE